MKTFAEYEEIADRSLFAGNYPAAEQNYLNAIFAYEGDEDEPDIDFEFYLRLGEAYTGNRNLHYANGCYLKVMEIVYEDDLTSAMVHAERAKMWLSFKRDDEALFDLRAAKKRLRLVDDPDLDDLKQMLCVEVEKQVKETCGYVYGTDMPWPVDEPALASV
jgi:tetratricopeptide (TPR) repeat protein